MIYPDINPIALDLGFVKIYWYGIMYLLAFLSAYFLANYRAKQLDDWNIWLRRPILYPVELRAHKLQVELIIF
jgi:prolipoprotein diacylglyceryltransferase